MDVRSPYALVNYGIDFDLAQKHPSPMQDQSVDPAENVLLIEEVTPTRIGGNTISSVLSLGVSHLLLGSYNFYCWIKRGISAHKHFDFEATIESVLRLLGLPLAMAHSIEGVVIFFLFMVVLSLSSLILGEVFVLIELSLELYRLVKILQIKSDLSEKEISKLLLLFKFDEKKSLSLNIKQICKGINENRETIEKHLGKEYFDKLQQVLKKGTKETSSIPIFERQLKLARVILLERKIQKLCNDYLTLSLEDYAWVNSRTLTQLETKSLDRESDMREARNEYLALMEKGKLEKLSRRIGTSMATKLKDHHEHFLPYVGKGGIKLDMLEETSHRLYFELCEQTKKALQIHIVGVLDILTGALTLALAYIAAPTIPIISLAVLGFSLHMLRFIAPQSYLDQEGSQFSLESQKNSLLNFLGFGKGPKKHEWIEMKPLVDKKEPRIDSEQCTRL